MPKSNIQILSCSPGESCYYFTQLRWFDCWKWFQRYLLPMCLLLRARLRSAICITLLQVKNDVPIFFHFKLLALSYWYIYPRQLTLISLDKSVCWNVKNVDWQYSNISKLISPLCLIFVCREGACGYDNYQSDWQSDWHLGQHIR